MSEADILRSGRISLQRRPLPLPRLFWNGIPRQTRPGNILHTSGRSHSDEMRAWAELARPRLPSSPPYVFAISSRTTNLPRL